MTTAQNTTTHLALVRHGQTDWNVEGRWQGQADPPLNERGREQARLAAQAMRSLGLTVLYSSDLQRAVQTAQIIGEELRLAPLMKSRLREIHLGEWQGMLSTEIQTRYPEAFREWVDSPLTARPPGGETIEMLAQRVLIAINSLVQSHPHERVAVVSHELPIAVTLCRAAGMGLEHMRELIPANGAWSEIVVNGALT